MTRVIHKLALDKDVTTLRISEGAFKVLCINEQQGIPTLWYETMDELVIPVEVSFYIFPTGAYIEPEKMDYIGTAFCNGFVWHVYQSPPTRFKL